MKILVIDDDPLVRRTVEKIVQRAGHEVHVAGDGRRGMALFRQQRPDLVITDVIMPEQEGLGTIMMIRREQPDAKIIVISGGGRMGNLNVLEAAEQLGADRVVAKPFDPTALLDLVRELAPSESVE